MKRLILAAIVAATMIAPATAQSPSVPPPTEEPSSPSTAKMPTFAGVPWGSSRAQVKALMRAKSYSDGGAIGHGDLAFTGRIDNRPADVHFLFSPTTGLAKVAITITTNTRNLSDARVVYDDTVNALRKYGAPEQAEIFKYPFKKGDGDEDLAMRAGKLDIFSIWKIGSRDGHPYGITAGIERDMPVTIAYESPSWHAESQRRKASSTNDL